MLFPTVSGLQKEDSLTLSSDGISTINDPGVVVVVVVGARVVVVVVVGARVVVVVVVGARVVVVVVVVVGARVVVVVVVGGIVVVVGAVGVIVVVVGAVGFGLTVYIKPASKASCSFRQVNTVFAFPSES